MIDLSIPRPPRRNEETIRIHDALPGFGGFRIEYARTGKFQLTQQGGQPLTDPLAQALRNARPGDGIFIDTDKPIPRVDIGGNQSEKPYCAYWGDRSPIRDVHIWGRGAGETTLEGIGTWGGLGGFDGLRFEAMTIENGPGATGGAKAPVMVSRGSGGLLMIYNCHLGGGPHNWDGRAQKWGIWADTATLDARNVTVDPCQEHHIYAVNMQGDNIAQRVSPAFLEDSPKLCNGRTSQQWGARDDSLPSRGRLIIDDCHVVWPAYPQEGASTFTIFGWLGHAYILNCSDTVMGGVTESAGSIAVWRDSRYSIDNKRGRANRRVTIDNFLCDRPGADRHHIQVASFDRCDISDFTVRGNRTAIETGRFIGGAEGKMGKLRVHPHEEGAKLADHPGFQSGAAMSFDGRVLSPKEMERFAPRRRG
jgi:hypothetical protein